MRIFFVKDFDDRKYGGQLHKAGTNAIMWETTAIRAVTEGYAVKWVERHLVKIEKDEPQTETEATPKSAGADKGDGATPARKKAKKTETR